MGDRSCAHVVAGVAAAAAVYELPDPHSIRKHVVSPPGAYHVFDNAHGHRGQCGQPEQLYRYRRNGVWGALMAKELRTRVAQGTPLRSGIWRLIGDRSLCAGLC